MTVRSADTPSCTRTPRTRSSTAPPRPEELAAAAAVHGYGAVALTDHDGIWGAMEFAHACKGLGVKAITGAEVTLDDGSHLTLLAENRTGYSNLCRLLTRGTRGTRASTRASARRRT